MMDKMHFIKVLTVWLGTASAWLISAENAELAIKILAGILACAYTIWRWLRDKREKERKK